MWTRRRSLRHGFALLAPEGCGRQFHSIPAQGKNELNTLSTALGKVHVAGHEVRWSALLQDVTRAGRTAPYAFQRERFWLDELDEMVGAGMVSAAANEDSDLSRDAVKEGRTGGCF